MRWLRITCMALLPTALWADSLEWTTTAPNEEIIKGATISADITYQVDSGSADLIFTLKGKGWVTAYAVTNTVYASEGKRETSLSITVPEHSSDAISYDGDYAYVVNMNEKQLFKGGIFMLPNKPISYTRVFDPPGDIQKNTAADFQVTYHTEQQRDILVQLVETNNSDNVYASKRLTGLPAGVHTISDELYVGSDIDNAFFAYDFEMYLLPPGSDDLQTADHVRKRPKITVYSPSKEHKKYNVLFIGVDDLRTEIKAFHKDNDNIPIHTDNLDKFSESALVFRRAYCQQSVCSASRASLMAGCRPDTTGVLTITDELRNTMPYSHTVSQMFKQAGYTTSSIGKIFHHYDEDDKHLMGWSEPSFKSQKALYQDKDTPKNELPATERGKVTNRGKAIDDSSYMDGGNRTEAINRLARYETSGENFFLAVGFHRPHLPFCAPDKYWKWYDNMPLYDAPYKELPIGAPEYAGTPFYELNKYTDLDDYWDGTTTNKFPQSKVHQLIQGYYASVSYVDAMLGQVIDYVDNSPTLSKNTIIVLWGDHGWKLNDYGEWSKQTNYEIDTRVPLMIRVPGMDSAKGSTTALAELVDMYPTLADLCDLKPPKGYCQGLSLRPVLEDPQINEKDPSKWKEAAFSQYHRSIDKQKGIGYSIRYGKYRYTEWRLKKHNLQKDILQSAELYEQTEDDDRVCGTNLYNQMLVSNPELIETLSGVLNSKTDDGKLSFGTGWQNIQKRLKAIYQQPGEDMIGLPVADAGQNQIINLGSGDLTTKVYLKGSDSFDADGTIQHYVWSTNGVTIAEIANPTISGLGIGVYNITLTVTDNDSQSASDIVRIEVKGAGSTTDLIYSVSGAEKFAPGSSYEVTINYEAQEERDFLLYFQNTDVSRDDTKYEYIRLSAPETSGIEDGKYIIDFDLGTPTVGESYEIYVALTSDGGGFSNRLYKVVKSDPKKCVSTISKIAPVADAGSDQVLTLGSGEMTTNVALDGSGSIDSDGSIVRYSWQTNEVEFASSKTASVNLGSGVYTIQLIVTDNDSQSASDLVRIEVKEPATSGNDIIHLVSGPNKVVQGGTYNIAIEYEATLAETLMVYCKDNDHDGSNYAWKNIEIAPTAGIITTNLTIQMDPAEPPLADNAYTFFVRLVTNSWSGLLSAETIPNVSSVLTIDDGAPVANAGSDQIVTLAAGTSNIWISLDGSGSTDVGGSIVSYAWIENGATLAARDEPNVKLSMTLGVHTIDLVVTDNEENSSLADQVVITVKPAASVDFVSKEDAVGDTPHTILEWTAQNGINYTLSWSTNLSESFTVFSDARNLPYPRNSYTDVLHSAASSKYYKLSVEQD